MKNEVESITTNTQAAADPQPEAFTPEQLVEQIRAIRTGLGDLTPLTSAQREKLRRQRAPSNDILQAQINLISDPLQSILGRQPEEVRQKVDVANRWTAVADELRKLLEGIEGTNLTRWHEIAIVASHAGNVGASLAKLPQYSDLVPQVKELRRLKRLKRRKRPAQGSPASKQHTAA